MLDFVLLLNVVLLLNTVLLLITAAGTALCCRSVRFPAGPSSTRANGAPSALEF